MKIIRKTTLVAGSALLILSCGEGRKEQSVEINTPEEIQEAKEEVADIADVSFINGMTGKVFHNYLQIKIALVNSDASAVQSAADNLVESFSEERNELKELAQQMAATDTLETQRALFAEFTLAVEPLIRGAISEGKIYRQYCPMAFDNQGAYWLADREEIRNPYFGNDMLTCGETKEVIQ